MSMNDYLASKLGHVSHIAGRHDPSMLRAWNHPQRPKAHPGNEGGHAVQEGRGLAVFRHQEEFFVFLIKCTSAWWWGSPSHASVTHSGEVKIAKTDAELNNSLIFRHQIDETSSAVTRSPRLGIPLSQVSAALGKEHRYHPSLLSGTSFALAVGYEGSPQTRDVHCK